jgi:tetratricopeptide (TPR) repeat protein
MLSLIKSDNVYEGNTYSMELASFKSVFKLNKGVSLGEDFQDNQIAFLENLNRIIRIDSNNSDAYINRSLYYRRRKNYKKAQEDFDIVDAICPNIFYIVSFNEEDIFKYGKFQGILKRNYFQTIMERKANLELNGKISILLYLKPSRKGEFNMFIFQDISKLSYFFFRKIYKKPIKNETFVKFEFQLAKALFYINTYIFRKKIRTVLQ